MFNTALLQQILGNASSSASSSSSGSSDYLDSINKRLEDILSRPEAPWYKNGDTLSGYAGLASALTGIAGFKDQKDLLNTQTKGLKQNIAFAKEDQERRNKNISGFNSFGSSSPVSAFASKI